MIRQQGPGLRTMTSRKPDQEGAPREFSRQGVETDLTPQLRTLLDGHSLSADAASDAFEAMMSGEVHHGEMGALLALLANRGPSRDELLGAARVMRRHVSPIACNTPSENILDTAGTGGAPKTFNVSTAAAIVAAGAGAVVAKHGNRSRTGRGSAEVLQGLGVNVDAGTDVQARCLDEARICFCFAIHHHPATRHVMPVRKALGVPTIFNLLGPLTNPAGAGRQLMGIYDGTFLEVIGEVFVELGTRHAMVLHSEDGLDECSLSAPTNIIHVRDGTLDRLSITPEQAGLASAPREAVTARDLDHAVELVRGVVDGSLQGPPLDMTLLNAAAALLVSDLCETIQEGVDLARTTIGDGAAMRTLEQLSELSSG
ncbi:MAG: anthranilate phosphoribosyltransferase [Phycisphaerae bacterium]|nr:anthranilate phosphoribosyltransferase [Phycisphaerae bacterium]